MATHSSILAWKIPWREEPFGYSPQGRKELEMIERLSAHTHTHTHKLGGSVLRIALGHWHRLFKRKKVFGHLASLSLMDMSLEEGVMFSLGNQNL